MNLSPEDNDDPAIAASESPSFIVRPGVTQCIFSSSLAAAMVALLLGDRIAPRMPRTPRAQVGVCAMACNVRAPTRRRVPRFRRRRGVGRRRDAETTTARDVGRALAFCGRMTTRDTRHRVVIVGGGFGGLFAARTLRRADVEVTVVDRTNHHLFQPLLYQLATGILSEGDIAPPIRDILRKQRNTEVVLGEVVDVDLVAREVAVEALGARRHLPYDSLIVAAGASQSYFGHPEFARDAPGMKTIDHALELRGRIFGAFEMAEREPDADARRRWLTFVVVGAGPTGVEIAGQIAELARRSLRQNFRRIDPAEANVILIEAAPTILSAFPDALRHRAERDLLEAGVEVQVGTMVTGIDERGITTSSAVPRVARIEAATKIWAAGVQASPLGRLLAGAAGAELDRAGRVKVQSDCSLPGFPDVFVVGDLMSLDNLPAVAQVAIQSGQHAARTIARRVRGDTTHEPFRYRDRGTMATISRHRAIVTLGRLRVAGHLGWVMWLVVHLMALTGFKNRVSVLFNWIIAFLGRGRPQRTITAQQVFARHALEARPCGEERAS